MLSIDRPVSIQIGIDSVKVAQILERRGRIGTVRFAEQALPSGFRWEIGGDHFPLVEAIRQALATAGIRSRRAVLVLPRRQVTARISAFPPADRQGLRQVIEYELADHIPFPIDQVVLDFQPLGGSSEQPGLTDVLVVAAPRDLVREYLRVISEAGLSAHAVSVDGLALHDLVSMVEREPVGLTVALAIGSRATTINVVDGSRLRLTRSIASGSYQLTRAIENDLGLSAVEAEQAKMSDGLHLLTREPRPPGTAAWFANLAGEVRRSARSFGSAPIARIVAADGDAPTPGLADALQAEFDLEPILLSAAELFDGSQLVGADPGAADRCLVAMGGALRGAGRSQWDLSLLPGEVIDARRAARLRTAGILASVTALAVMAVGYATAARQLALRRAKLPDLRAQAALADQDCVEGELLLAEHDQLRAQMAPLEVAQARRYSALELLRTMSLYSPDDVVLNSFAMRHAQPLEIVATAPTAAMAVDFQQTLAGSPLVKQVDLENLTRVLPGGSRRPDDAQVRFTLKAPLWADHEPATEPARIPARERSP